MRSSATVAIKTAKNASAFITCQRPGAAALNYEKTRSKTRPAAPADGVLGEGNFVCNRPDADGPVRHLQRRRHQRLDRQADLERHQVRQTRTLAAHQRSRRSRCSVGIAINKQGDVVVGQFGEVNKPQDSLLTFYGAGTKKRYRTSKRSSRSRIGLFADDRPALRH